MLWSELPLIKAIREIDARRIDAPLDADRVYAIERLLTDEKTAEDAFCRMAILESKQHDRS